MNLHAQRAAAIKSARAILDGAKADGDRDLTPEEAEEVEAFTAEVKTIDRKLKGRELVKSVMSLGGPGDGEEEAPEGGEDTPAKSLGEHFAKHVKADGFTQLKTRSGFTVSAPEFKAATDPHTVGEVWAERLTTVDYNVVRPYRTGPIVADLLGSGTIAGNAVSYFVEGPVEGDFETVPELGQKPQLHVGDPTQVTDSLRKIAAWWDMSDEMVEDLPFMVSEINNRGLYMLAMAEERQLLNGNGTGTNLRGLLNRSGLQTEVSAATEDHPDALFRAMMKVQTATGLGADGIVINPVDYQRLRLARDGNGQYFGGGFFSGQYGNGGVPEQPPLWGTRTVVTSAVPAGTALVGAFKAAATVYRKGGIRVESTNSDAGKFTSNIVTTRVEERVALAVRIPSAVVRVTLGAAA